MSKFITMDQAMLEKTKNDKILPRFAKKGGETIKKLAQAIMDNAANSTKRKLEAAKNPSKNGAPADSNKVDIPFPHVVIRNPPELNSKKRVREPEDNKPPPPKRVVSPTGAKTALKPSTIGAQRNLIASNNGKSTQQIASQSMKPKANVVAPKAPPSLFSSLMSAGKKPGTSNAARAAAAAAAKEKAKMEQKDAASRPAAAVPAFSFSETMADLGKPKERVATAEPVEERPPETDEERKKRLRKEERRKLRVTWKPDESLTEVRLFTHDPEEEIGHDESMIRDVGDLAGEGRMLKMHRDLDMEDEDENEGGVLTYKSPTAIDFVELDAQERERNFLKTGGTKLPDSPSKLDQEQREATTLSVFYTSPADIPISPKEPPPHEDDSYDPVGVFGEPDGHAKARSEKYFAARAPPAPPPPAPAEVANPGQVNINNLLSILQQNQQPQQQQPASSSNISDLEKTFSQFSGQSQPQMPQAAQVPQIPGAPGLDLTKILSLVNMQKQMQQPPAFPQQPPAASQTPNLAAVLSQFGMPGAPQQQQQPPQQYGYSAQNSQVYENPERKRYRESGGKPDRDEPAYNDNNNNNKRFRANGEFKSKKHPKVGSVPCRYWKEGRCLKGTDCTFRHDPLD